MTSLGQNSSVGTRELLGDEGRWKGGPGPGISQAIESGLLWHQQRGLEELGAAGVEVPGTGGKQGTPLPLPCPVLFSLQTLTRGERGCSGSRGSHSRQNPQGGLPGLRAMWQGPLVGRPGHAAVQHEATLSAQVSPHPRQTWCLDAPTPAGTV